MAQTTLKIKEQTPTATSIFCEVSLTNRYGGSISYGSMMYFVCNLEKVITQYFPWQLEPEYKQQIEALGYSFLKHDNSRSTRDISEQESQS